MSEAIHLLASRQANAEKGVSLYGVRELCSRFLRLGIARRLQAHLVRRATRKYCRLALDELTDQTHFPRRVVCPNGWRAFRRWYLQRFCTIILRTTSIVSDATPRSRVHRFVSIPGLH